MEKANSLPFGELSEIRVDGKEITRKEFETLWAKPVKIRAFGYTRINGVAKLRIATV